MAAANTAKKSEDDKKSQGDKKGQRSIRRGSATGVVRRKMRIKKNDNVKVISGRDKGKTGRVLEVNRSTGKVLVEGAMMIKRHTKPNPAKQVKGGIAEKESYIDASNVMVLTAGGVPTRVGYKIETEGGKTRRIRVARKTGETLDKKG